MRPIRLKTSAIEDVTGYSRFRLRGLLSEVFPSPARMEGASSHRTFSPQDLLVASVACEIEQKYGVERKKLASIANALRQALRGPRGANRNARLLIIFAPPTATYLDVNASVSEGLVVALGPLFAKVDEYLGVSSSSHENVQPILSLRPSIAASRRSGSSRSR